MAPPPNDANAHRSGGRAAAYGALFRPKEVARRVSIAWGIFLDHQFERASTIPALAPHILERIGDHEVTLPPPRLLGAAGNQPVEGLLFLASLGRALGAARVFEIGTFNGLTAWCLARNLPGATIDTLDLPVDQQPALPLAERDPLNRSAQPERLYESLPSPGRVVQHWGDSATFDFSPWHRGCDLVYVDGAHSADYVSSDSHNAFEMIAESGAIVWDDYWRHEPGVRSVLEKQAGRDLHRVPGTRLVVYLSEPARRRLTTTTA